MNTPSKPILGLDCDGVVADMNGYAIVKINEELGTDFTLDDWNDWSVSKCLGDAAHEVFKRHLDDSEIWTSLPMYPDMIDTLDRLAAVYELYMVSSVWHKFYPLRKAWVSDRNLPFSRVIAASDKSSVAVKHNMVGFIEDRQDKARAVRDAGIKSYLIARPYNWIEEGITRGTWSEVLSHLLPAPLAD